MTTSWADAGLYNLKSLRQDFSKGLGGFSVQFEGCTLGCHFTWRDIINNPFTFMFVGAPLEMCRSYDLIFKKCGSLQTTYHHFINYYNHCKGDVKVSLSLYNSYLARRSAILDKNLMMLTRRQTSP